MSRASTVDREAGIDVRVSSARQRPDTSFGQLVRRGIAGSAQAVQERTGAGYLLGGGAVVSAAISQAGALADGGIASSREALASGGPPRAGKMSPEELYEANRDMQERNQAFNMRVLHLQEETQHQTRAFSTWSNLLKTRHEALRNTISNLR